VVGRFLEHTRICYFLNDGAEDVFLSSADWMDRNVFRRIELGIPLLDPALRARVVREGLLADLDDTGQAWVMRSDGGYEPLAPRQGAGGAGRTAARAGAGRVDQIAPCRDCTAAQSRRAA
jgi:polyphosphate kinase